MFGMGSMARVRIDGEEAGRLTLALSQMVLSDDMEFGQKARLLTVGVAVVECCDRGRGDPRDLLDRAQAMTQPEWPAEARGAVAEMTAILRKRIVS